MGTTYSKHKQRIDTIQAFCVDNQMNLVEMWECDYDRYVKQDKELQKLIKSGVVNEPLNPRDCLFGGRTNAFVLYYRVKVGEKIKYYDFCSLYPYVQKYGIFPIGHPTLITENFNNRPFKEYFGVIKCKILPPKQLYTPLLPAHINNKLVFSLCSECASTKSAVCTHSDDERALKGTWVSLEIMKAIELGYVIQETYEIWHWEETAQYNRLTHPNIGLFVKYINSAI